MHGAHAQEVQVVRAQTNHNSFRIPNNQQGGPRAAYDNILAVNYIFKIYYKVTCMLLKVIEITFLWYVFVATSIEGVSLSPARKKRCFPLCKQN
jgi:hypothetical protein